MPVGETGLDGIVAHGEEMGGNLGSQEIPFRAHDAPAELGQRQPARDQQKRLRSQLRRQPIDGHRKRLGRKLSQDSRGRDAQRLVRGLLGKQLVGKSLGLRRHRLDGLRRGVHGGAGRPALGPTPDAVRSREA